MCQVVISYLKEEKREEAASPHLQDHVQEVLEAAPARVFASQVGRREVEQIGPGLCAHGMEQHLFPHA